MPPQTPIARAMVTPRTTVRIPSHVVSRAFATETVVLNLETGLYHSLNPTGGRMLEVLGEVGLVQAAIEKLAAEYDRPVDAMTRDLCEFCLALAEQGLIQIVAFPRQPGR
jgi:hypothetical protein